MSSNFLKIGFIGGGKMAQAMAKGFISAGLAKGESIVSSCHPADRASATAFRELGAETVFENIPVVKNSDIIFLSVKPSVVPIALKDFKQDPDVTTGKLLISIIMGLTINHLEQYFPSKTRIIRAMPNTPALVQKAASVFVKGPHVTDQDLVVTRRLLQSIGTCEQVSEQLLDAVTALSGSGPAYIYVLIEALADGGVKMGLPRDMAYRLASQTVLGAGQMVRDTKIHPGVLKDDVASPKGSTCAALHFLEKNRFRAAVIGAVEAATQRCRETADSVK